MASPCTGDTRGPLGRDHGGQQPGHQQHRTRHQAHDAGPVADRGVRPPAPGLQRGDPTGSAEARKVTPMTIANSTETCRPGQYT